MGTALGIEAHQPAGPRPPWVLLFVLGSLLLHVSVIALASRGISVPPPPKPPDRGELVEVDVMKPPPPPPPVEITKPPPPPKIRPQIHVASVAKPLPPPPTNTPPPPNQETHETPARNPPPLVVGVTMSSTSTAGSFSAPVGNTAYGRTGDTAQDPSTVKGYSAPHYAPISEVDAQPELVSEFKPAYPEEARKAGVEGRVTLQITVDEHGNVTSAKVIHGLGYGLDEAAREGMLHARFKPATRGGAPVATLLTFAYRFELP